jgi:acyl-CoA synthetase (AMP-forming)/AMP-acid ligase II
MPGYRSFVDVVTAHASAFPDRAAVVFSADPTDPAGDVTVRYGQLAARAQAVGAVLRSLIEVGDRVLLLCGPGPAFAAGFLGSLHAGMIAVPAPPPDGDPRERERLARVARDCGATALLTDSATEKAVRGWARATGLERDAHVVVTDRLEGPSRGALRSVVIGPHTVAYLQYTSGATGDPKGVRIDHGHLLATCRAVQRRLDLQGDDRVGGWLPMYHELGLIGQCLAPWFAGALSVSMPPSDFPRRPHTWLRLIDRHGITVSCAPDGAYDLCARQVTDSELAGVDLSRWRVAVNASAPVRPHTARAFVDRFAPFGLRPDAMRTGYELAEATVSLAAGPEPLVVEVDAGRLERGAIVPAAGGGGPRRELVGSGPALEGVEIRIVDPRSRRTLEDGLVGEVWVRGAGVSRGYWRQRYETARVFSNTTAEGASGFLRTGDLGGLRDGELFVTGRIADLVVIDGRALCPRELEAEARGVHDALAEGTAAAFTVDSEVGPQLVMIHECPPDAGPLPVPVAVVSAVRNLLQREYGLAASVVLVRPGTVPRTTSGKIQRRLTRELFTSGQLAVEWESLTPEVRRAYRLARPALAEPEPRSSNARSVV